MKKSSKYFSFLFLLLVGLVPFAFGQERTGNIEGIVNDQNSALLPGADVQVTGLDIGFSRNLKSNADGSFRLLQVPPGRYRITVSSTGFQNASSEVVVNLGQTSAVNFNLQVTTTATVEVTSGDVASIDTESNKIQTNISDRRIELTPKATTNFAGVLRVSPAVREEPLGAGFQIDGARGQKTHLLLTA